MDVQRWLQLDEAYIRERIDVSSTSSCLAGNITLTCVIVQAMSSAHALLDAPITCFKCDEPFHSIPRLKTHLEKEFAREKEEALKQIAKHGRQTSSDEDLF